MRNNSTKEIKNLTQFTVVDKMSEDVLIPIRAITSIPLNVFSQWGYSKSFLRSNQVKEEEAVEELGCMQHLTNLSICVCESSSAQKIFQSQSLRRCIRRECINNINGNLTSIVINYSSKNSGGFSHLETLHLFNCAKLREMEITQRIGRAPNYFCFPNLVEVQVYRCGLSDLSWLVHAPELRELAIEECNWMEKIIVDGFAGDELAASGLFSRLERLELIRLPKLTSICDQALSFPLGVSFVVLECPGLRKLPLDSSSARGSFEVLGDGRWWAKFEWDPTAPVTLELRGVEGPVKETTFGEAVRKVKDRGFGALAKIGFPPRGGPSE